MTKIRSGLFALIGIAGLFGLSNCGNTYSGDPGPTADVRGNIEATNPDAGDRDIVVFVYWIRESLEDCSDPQLPENTNNAFQSRILKDGETVFEVRNSQAGSLVVAFLLDEDRDRRIDDGDAVAVLEDPDCVLDDVPNKYIVQVDDVRINFSDDDEPGFPAPGRAEADSLTEAPE